MSTVFALGLNNESEGHFDGIVPSIAWCLDGHPSVSGGGNTTVEVPDETAAATWLNFGRMVAITPEDLPSYVGMIDTPWVATLPVKMTIYDAEYLLNLRVAENAPAKYAGNVANILDQIIKKANEQEELYIRLGNTQGIDTTYREETLDGRTLWEQTKALLERSGTEMIFRARQIEKRWYIFLDISKRIGFDTDFLLSDGENGNMKINSATVNGEIINRMIGISSQSTAASRLQTDPMEDAVSRSTYRMRSRFAQFRDVTEKSTLNSNTLNNLNAAKNPYLELSVDVENIDHAFLNLRLGNSVMTHASKIHLPNGVRGWRGKTRITKMAFVEKTKTVNMTLTGEL